MVYMTEDGTIIAQGGIFILVQYPHRKQPHLYVGLEDHPIHCCQCKADIAPSEDQLLEHISGHDTRSKRRRGHDRALIHHWGSHQEMPAF